MIKSKGFLLALAALLAISPLTFANGLNLNSLGTRALSMGGAFVGLADDFSAIYWNPAGLADFQNKTFGFYGTDIIPSGTYKITIPSPYYLGIPPYSPTPVDTKTVTTHYLGGMVAYIHPITPNLVAGIGVFTPSGLGANWDGSQLAFISGGSTNIEWKSKIGIVTIAPTLAYKVNDKLSFGASLNINYGMFDTSMYAGALLVAPGVTVDLGQYKESETGWGIGATFGVLYKPCHMFSFGATFRTASTVGFSGSASISKFPSLGLNGSSDMNRDVTWPMWLAGGVAYKPLDNLTVTADIQWTQWSKIKAFTTTYVDPVWAVQMTASGKNVMEMDWSDKMQIRFGAEYRLNASLALRAGYYFDPAPAPDTTMNILLPNYDFNGLTFGLGYSLGALQLDAGFEYLIGKDRDVPFLSYLTDPTYVHAQPGTYGMKILAPNISISYKF